MSNINARLRRLERARGGKGEYPLMLIQGEDETEDQAVARHLAENPGLEDHLAKHSDKFLLILDV